MFKAFGHSNIPDVKPVLEINPDHPIITKMAQMEDIALFEEAAKLILEQAMITEGLKISDPHGFAQRLAKFMEKAL
jgi:molecular chaperone HtpG